jgi:hypothetical protein
VSQISYFCIFNGGNFRLADELVRANVDMIVTGSSPGASAAKNATSTIPIVMVTTGACPSALVASLAPTASAAVVTIGGPVGID